MFRQIFSLQLIVSTLSDFSLLHAAACNTDSASFAMPPFEICSRDKKFRVLFGRHGSTRAISTTLVRHAPFFRPTARFLTFLLRVVILRAFSVGFFFFPILEGLFCVKVAYMSSLGGLP